MNRSSYDVTWRLLDVIAERAEVQREAGDGLHIVMP